MGREIYELSTKCQGYKKDYLTIGFLDDDLDALNSFSGYPRILARIADYSPKENDIFICSIGNTTKKKNSVDRILEKGGTFISLIHPSVHIGKNSTVGIGSILLKDAFIGVDCKIGDHVLIQISAVIGHDAIVGNYSRVDCHVVCVGGTQLHEEVTVHTSSIINHNVVVENGATIGAGSFVIRRVPSKATVFGNPARRL
jgi:sugar O-acyltransferase (sialic acid O-acetyltransferase NeuD family)